MVKEIWKDVPGYEGLYQVSNLGRVRSLDRYIPHSLGGKSFVKGRILSDKPRGKNGRYCRVILYRNGIHLGESVHRIVAKTFIPNPDNKPQVNHINGIRTDNRVANLEWCTAKENDKHAWDIGLKNSLGSNQSNAILHEDDIPGIKRLIEAGLSNREIGKKYGIEESTISLIKLGKRWTHVEGKMQLIKLNPTGRDPLDNVKILCSHHGNQKLTIDDVINIKLLLKAGVRQKMLVQYYGVSKSVISGINTGACWAHVIV